MDVLVTAATGYVGAAIADALLAAGHQVSGLARSEETVGKLEERGIAAVRGDITDAGGVRGAARFASPPECGISWTLVHRDELGELYARLLGSSSPDGGLLVAAGDGPYRVSEIASAAGQTADGTGLWGRGRWRRLGRSLELTPMPSPSTSDSPGRRRGVCSAEPLRRRRFSRSWSSARMPGRRRSILRGRVGPVISDRAA